ncbi:MAG: hypothetical protein NVSMB56_07980 [Pyrinomonadaceae bacterium]
MQTIDFLTEILALKRARVEQAKRARPLEILRDAARRVRETAKKHT